MDDNKVILNRDIYLFSNVDNESACNIVSAINEINKQDDKNESKKWIIPYKREPIKLIINSYGGYVSSMFAIISTIINSKTPIHTYVTGTAQSAAAMITMCGNHRSMSKYGILMIHDIAGTLEGNSAKIKNYMQEWDLETNSFKELFEVYSNIPMSIVDDFIENGNNLYLTPEEALRYGIIDEII